MNDLKIDVIIAVYNGASFIEEAIQSVQKQTFAVSKIILVDDGSTDSTLQVLMQLSKEDSRIEVIACPHRGVSATLNEGIKASTAPWIAFLDADDVWEHNKLEQQRLALQKTNASICFTLMQEFDNVVENIAQKHIARIDPLKGYSKTSFLGKSTLFEQYGMFNEAVAIGDFIDWYSRIVRANEQIVMVEEVLAYRRIHQNNTTSGISKNDYLKLLKMHLDEKRTKVS